MRFRSDDDYEPIICYPLSITGSKWQCNELRYSLRSLQEHWYQEGKVKVYILTDCDKAPEWLKNCNLIHAKGYCEAVKAATRLAREESPTGHYVWMNDDIFFLKPTCPNDLIPVRLQAKSCGKPYQKYLPDNSWTGKLHMMRDKLSDFEMSDGNFCSHLPYLFHWRKMEMTWARFGLQYKLPLETAYYNMWEYPSVSKRDKVCFFKKKHPPTHIDGLRFLNIAEAGMTSELRAWITGLFPHRSKYERPK